MGRVVVLFACVCVMHPAGAAAEERGPVLFFCDEEAIGECAELLGALRKEMGDFGLDVMAVYEPIDVDALPHGRPPGVVERATAQEGATFATWLLLEGELLVIHVFDPGTEQTFSKQIAVREGIDCKQVAFRLRSLMGASLYAELDDILVDEDLMALAVPPEKVEVIEEVMQIKARRRSWVGLCLDYLLLSYPTEDFWAHGLAFEVHVIPVSRLEVLLDGALTFPRHVREVVEEGVELGFGNEQYLVGLGARYAVLDVGRVAVLPEAGFRLGISVNRVTWQGDEKFVDINPALWAGLRARVRVVRRVGLELGMRFANLFRYEGFTWRGHHVTGLAQFRFSAYVGVRVAI
jgi:hypothetical protein